MRLFVEVGDQTGGDGHYCWPCGKAARQPYCTALQMMAGPLNH